MRLRTISPKVSREEIDLADYKSLIIVENNDRFN